MGGRPEAEGRAKPMAAGGPEDPRRSRWPVLEGSHVVAGRSVGAVPRPMALDDGRLTSASLCAEDSGRWRAPPGAPGALGVASIVRGGSRLR